jgi:hypothetical protein
MPIDQQPYELADGEELLWHGGNADREWWRLFFFVMPLFNSIVIVSNPRITIGFRRVYSLVGALSFAGLVWFLSQARKNAEWRKQWMYAATNRRIIVREYRNKIRSVLLSEIGDLRVYAEPSGFGGVVIGYSKGKNYLTYLTLSNIENPREVFALIEKHSVQ